MSPFIALIITAIGGGLLLGIPIQAIVKSIQKGIGELLGGIIILLSVGAMIGKLVAESGAADVIATRIMTWFGERYLQWGLMLTGLIIGIPLFYNVGFVLVVPIIFSLVQKYRLSVIYVAIPILASLSVAHSLLPPHPSPSSLVVTFQANMGMTFLYGLIVAIPAVIIAGPFFSKFLQKTSTEKPFSNSLIEQKAERQPSFGVSLFAAILPVFLFGFTTILNFIFADDLRLKPYLDFVNEPTILMLFSLLGVSYLLGISRGISLKELTKIYENGIKEIAVLLLIIGASGALKQVLIESNISSHLTTLFQNTTINPLILAWVLAAVIRISLGSATVAGLTAAGILAPMLPSLQINPNLLVLAIGSGSIFCSHVNDTGFWMFKEYFDLNLKQTFLSWTIMESIVSIVGLLGVLFLSIWL